MFSRSRHLLFQTVFRAAGVLAFGAILLNFSACRQPPSPPIRAEGSEFAVNYATFFSKKDADFKRISEFFTDEENSGNNVVVRSDPEVRDGVYLVLNLESGARVPAGSVAELRYFHPTRKGEQLQRWALPEFSSAPHRELRLGLTGSAWEKSVSAKRPSAWELRIVSPDGKLLVLRRSFLWKTENS